MDDIKKLKQIWSSYEFNENTEIERFLLLHLLGETQNNLDIQLTWDTYDGEKLFNRLSKAVRRLLTRAYANTLKQNPAYQAKKDEVARLKVALQRKEVELESIKVKLAEAQNALSQSQEQQQILQAKTDRVEKSNSQLKERITALSNTIEDYKNIEKEKYASLLSIANLQTKNTTLNDKIGQLERVLKEYQTSEKQVLPTLKKTLYTQSYRGKSITLSSSKIEKVIKMHLEGASKYKISKDLSISKCSITKILTCDYKTSTSCKKVLGVLHEINGNWATEKKSKLLNLISLYEEAYESASKIEEAQKENAISSIHTIKEFLEQKRVLENRNIIEGEM